jgi:hypothetical protein
VTLHETLCYDVGGKKDQPQGGAGICAVPAAAACGRTRAAARCTRQQAAAGAHAGGGEDGEGVMGRVEPARRWLARCQRRIHHTPSPLPTPFFLNITHAGGTFRGVIRNRRSWWYPHFRYGGGCTGRGRHPLVRRCRRRARLGRRAWRCRGAWGGRAAKPLCAAADAARVADRRPSRPGDGLVSSLVRGCGVGGEVGQLHASRRAGWCCSGGRMGLLAHTPGGLLFRVFDKFGLSGTARGHVNAMLCFAGW